MFHGDVGAAPRSTGDIFTWKKNACSFLCDSGENLTMKQTALNYVAILIEACYGSQTNVSFIIHPELTLDFQYSCFSLVS